jgi:hypothetical protein
MAKLQEFFNNLSVKVISGILILSMILFIPIKFGPDGFKSISSIIYTELTKKAKEKICLYYFGNPAHAWTFIKITDELLPNHWLLALAVAERESNFSQYAYSTTTKEILDKGVKKTIRVVLCRGYFALDEETYKSIMKKYKVYYKGMGDIYDSSNNIFTGILHLRDCIMTYGEIKGIEIYNLGSGNYYYRGWRNPGYVSKVLQSKYIAENLFLKEISRLSKKDVK